MELRVNEAELQAAVEEKLGFAISDDLFRKIRKAAGEHMPFKVTAEDIAGLYHEYVEFGLVTPETVPQPPESWSRRSAEMLGRFVEDRARALEIAGWVQPVPLDESARWIASVSAAQRESGPVSVLRYVRRENFELADSRVGVVPRMAFVWRGYSDEELAEFSGRIPVPTPQRQREELIGSWRAGRESRLFRLQRIAHRLVSQTGCEEWEAIAYLLCGREFTPPWIKAGVDIDGPLDPSGAAGPWFAVRVFTSDASPEDVAAAYREARRRWLDGGGSNTRRPMSQDERDSRLLKLEAEWDKCRPKLLRKERWKLWNEQPDLSPGNRFRTPESMRVTYAHIRKRKGGEQQ